MPAKKKLDLDELIDAHAVAEILGLARATSVAVYRARYPDFPEPTLDLGRGRPMLWLRAEVEHRARPSGRLS